MHGLRLFVVNTTCGNTSANRNAQNYISVLVTYYGVAVFSALRRSVIINYFIADFTTVWNYRHWQTIVTSQIYKLEARTNTKRPSISEMYQSYSFPRIAQNVDNSGTRHNQSRLSPRSRYRFLSAGNIRE